MKQFLFYKEGNKQKKLYIWMIVIMSINLLFSLFSTEGFIFDIILIAVMVITGIYMDIFAVSKYKIETDTLGILETKRNKRKQIEWVNTAHAVLLNDCIIITDMSLNYIEVKYKKRFKTEYIRLINEIGLFVKIDDRGFTASFIDDGAVKAREAKKIKAFNILLAAAGAHLIANIMVTYFFSVTQSEINFFVWVTLAILVAGYMSFAAIKSHEASFNKKSILIFYPVYMITVTVLNVILGLVYNSVGGFRFGFSWMFLIPFYILLRAFVKSFIEERDVRL